MQRFFRPVIDAELLWSVLDMIHRFAGKVVLDFQKEQLLLDCRPNKSVSSAVFEGKSLSGGERAFATLAFLLAIGECMESPFRAIDGKLKDVVTVVSVDLPSVCVDDVRRYLSFGWYRIRY